MQIIKQLPVPPGFSGANNEADCQDQRQPDQQLNMLSHGQGTERPFITILKLLVLYEVKSRCWDKTWRHVKDYLFCTVLLYQYRQVFSSATEKKVAGFTGVLLHT